MKFVDKIDQVCCCPRIFVPVSVTVPSCKLNVVLLSPRLAESQAWTMIQKLFEGMNSDISDIETRIVPLTAIEQEF